MMTTVKPVIAVLCAVWACASARIIRACALALGALLLVGCSLMTVAYNQSVNLGLWWLDDFVAFDDGQTQLARSQLDALLQWHRRTEIPQLERLVASLQTQALAPTSADAVCAVSDQARQRFLAVVQSSVPGLTQLAVSLKPAQLQRLERELAKRHDKWRERWLAGSEEERLERRSSEAIERAEGFYGRLSPEQRALVRQHLTDLRLDLTAFERETLRRQRDLLDTTRQIVRANAANAAEVANPGAARALQQLLDRAAQSPDPAWQAQSARWQQTNCQLIAALHNAATPAQRQRAAQTLGNYAKDLRTLGAASSGRSTASL